MRSRFGLLVGVGLAALLGSAGAQDSPHPGPRVTLEGRALDLRPTVLELARAGRYGVAVGPDVAGTVDLSLRDEPWAKALAGVLRPRGLHAIVHGSVLAVSARAPDSNEVEITETSEPAGAEARSVWVGEPPVLLGVIDEHVDDAYARDVLLQIGLASGRAIAIEPEIREAVTVNLTRAPCQKAIAVVAAKAHCRVRSLPDLLVVEPSREVTLPSHEDKAVTLLRELALQAKASVVFAEDVASTPVLVELEADRWECALDAIADACGLHVARVGEVAVVARHPLPRVAPAPERWARRIPHVPTNLASGWLSAWALSVDRLDIADVVSRIAAVSEVPIAVVPWASSDVPVDPAGMPLDRALGVIAELARCEPVLVGEKAIVLEPATLLTHTWTDSDVRSAMGNVAGLSSRNLIVFPDGEGKGRVCAELNRAPWFDALRAFALSSDLKVFELAPGVLGVASVAHGPELERAPLAPRAEWRRPTGRHPLVRLELDQSDLPDVVRDFAAALGEEIEVSPVTSSVTGGWPLTLALPPCDGRDALEVVARVSRTELVRAPSGKLTLVPVPRHRGCYSGVELSAVGVTAASWFELLGRTLGEPIDVAPWLDRIGLVELSGPSPEPFVRATAELLGADVTPGAKSGLRLVRRPTTRAAAGAVHFSPRGWPWHEPDPELGDDERAALTASFDTIVKKLRVAASEEPKGERERETRPERETVATLLRELEKTIREADLAGCALARECAVRWRASLGQHHEVAEAISLTIAVAEGDRRLERISLAKANRNYPLMRDEALALERHAESVRRRSPSDEFQRRADALELRARSLVREAEKLWAIFLDYPIHMKAAAVDRRPGGHDRVVLAVEGPDPHERVYEVGESVRDWRGERLPVEFRVVRIDTSAVRLAGDGVEFSVPLDYPE